MRVFIGTYHGSSREMNAVTKAGYHFTLKGSMHVQEPIEGDPFEIARTLHECGNGEVKVAIGNFFIPKDGIQTVQIFVSDDWFHQR